VTNTITMGDLYARQGLVDDARQIYETILEREPENEGVRAKLETLPPGRVENPSHMSAKVAKMTRSPGLLK